MFARLSRYAGFALAALALATSVNLTPVAEAASGPDLRVKYINTTFNVNGTHKVDAYFTITNDGDKTSDTYLVHKGCAYLRYDGTVEWFEADPLHPTVGSPIESQGSRNLFVYCGESQGRTAVGVRVTVLSVGDTNTSNNDVKHQTFTL
jgi:hypothetical protein